MEKLKSITIVFVCFVCFLNIGNAQVLISDGSGDPNPDPTAMLEIRSTTQGLLIPRMTTLQREGITAVPGLLVYDLDEQAFFLCDNLTNEWIDLSSSADIWSKSGSDVILTNLEDNVGIGTDAPTGKFVIKADGTKNADDVLFEVIGTDGFPVFEVTTNGVKVSVNGDAKAVSRGFAVGQYSTAKAPGDHKDFFTIESDGSTKVHLYNDGTKAISGGFAVGQYTTAKGIAPEEYFNVLPEGTQINTTNPVSTGKAISRGFAVGQYTTAKAGVSNNYLYVKEDNAFIGYLAGENTELNGGTNNVFIGYMAGNTNTSGSGNVFIGNEAGASSVSDKLYISNGPADLNNALIYGNFATGSETINLNGALSFNKGLTQKIYMPTSRGVTDQVLTSGTGGNTAWRNADDLVTHYKAPILYVHESTLEFNFVTTELELGETIGTLVVKNEEPHPDIYLPPASENHGRTIVIKNMRIESPLFVYPDGKDTIQDVDPVPLTVAGYTTVTLQADYDKDAETGIWYINSIYTSPNPGK